MTQRIIVRLEIPIAEEYADALTFTGWLPNQKDGLGMSVNGDSVTVWFDDQLFQASDFDVDYAQLENQGDLRLNAIGIDVHVEGVDEEVLAVIQKIADEARATQRMPRRDCDAAKRYEELGLRVQAAGLHAANRVLTWFRVSKGQFWISSLAHDPENQASFFRQSQAKVSWNGTEWLPWLPSYRGALRMTCQDWGTRRVARDDWTDLKSWMTEASRPNLILELLADAEALASRGAARPALVQAVTALEVAIVRLYDSQFWQNAVKSSTAQAVLTGKKRIGFHHVLRTVLPAVLGNSEIPSEVLTRCQDAVKARNEIVHEGSPVDTETIESHMRPIRVLCERLLHLAKLCS
jgi:hypothetical protein